MVIWGRQIPSYLVRRAAAGPQSALSGLLPHHHAVAIAPPAHPQPCGTHRRKIGADGGGCTRLTRQTRPPKVKNHVFFVICRSQECRNRPKRLVYIVAEDISAAPPCVYIPYSRWSWPHNV
jgi:hypothetical protein